MTRPLTRPTPVGEGSWFQITARAERPTEADIYIHDDIGSWGISSAAFTKSFRELGKLSQINLHINSYGGDVFDGFAIYNLLMAERAKGASITAWVDGVAASISSVIAMAGEDIFMPENSSEMMIHDPSGVVQGTAEDMEHMAETMRSIKDNIVRIYAARTGRSPKDISALMAAETWMDGPRALAEGFATQLINVESKIAACARSEIVNKFGNVPQSVLGRLATKEYAPMSDLESETDAPGAERPESLSEVDLEAAIDRVSPKSETPNIHSQGERPGTWQTQATIPEPSDSASADERREKRREKHVLDAMNKAMDAGEQLGLLTQARQLLNDGVRPEQVPECLIRIFARQKATQAATHRAMPTDSGARIVYDYEDPSIVREQMSDAIAYHALKVINPSHKLPNNGAQKYLNYRATDFMRECVRRMNVREDPRNMTLSHITDEALGNTTSDFPNILGVSANKVFLGSYMAAESTYRAIAAQQNLPNFQMHNMIRAGDFPAILQLNEHGEITRGSMSESAEVAQLKSHGRTFGVTRQVLINDNLGAFNNMAAQAGRAVAVYENTVVWTLVNSNPTLATPNAAMFSTTNGNLTTGPGTAMAATSLGIGRAAMRIQESLDGNVLNVTPRILAVPASKETLAEQILSPLVIPTAGDANLVPAGLRSLNLVVEPLLDGNSTTAWYLFASPAQGSNIVYGYLSGAEAPRVRTNSPFNVDGIEFQVLVDFYAAAIDYRFGYKNVGA